MDHEDSTALLKRLGASNGHARRESPVLGLTNWGDLKSKLKAFDLGVDDIMSTPFSPEELLARAIAITRRTTGSNRPIVPTITLGDVEIDIVNRQVRVGQSVVHLSGIEQSLLYLLASRAGRVVAREDILDGIWGRTSWPRATSSTVTSGASASSCRTTTATHASSPRSRAKAIDSSRRSRTPDGALGRTRVGQPCPCLSGTPLKTRVRAGSNHQAAGVMRSVTSALGGRDDSFDGEHGNQPSWCAGRVGKRTGPVAARGRTRATVARIDDTTPRTVMTTATGTAV